MHVLYTRTFTHVYVYVCIYTRTLCVCSPTESEGGYTSLPRTSLSQDSGFDLMPPPRPVLESTVSLDSSQAAMAEGREEADGSGMSRSLDRRLLWVVADVRVRMCIIHICNNNTVHCNYMCIHIRTSCFGNLIICTCICIYTYCVSGWSASLVSWRLRTCICLADLFHAN